MQPVLMLAARVPGLIYVNGRPVGEGDESHPLVVPVSPRGAVYVELRPFVRGYLPLARRLTLSGGRVIPQSVDEAPGMAVVAWPDGALELTLTPESIAPEGEAEDGIAADATYMDDGSARVIEDLRDTVGHAYLHIYRLEDGAWRRAHTEILWASGAPNWPATPEATAIAAVEAQLLGLTEEAMGYLTPAAGPELAGALDDAVLGCVRLRTPDPSGRTAVGLVRYVSAQLAAVTPLYYAATPMGGTQGTWRLHDISVERLP